MRPILDAVCFSCGGFKNQPLGSCPHCKKQPTDTEEKIVSFALSKDCLKPYNLQKGSAYIKKKGRLPSFHENVRRKAAQLMENFLEVTTHDSDDLDLSDSFFDLDTSPTSSNETITVHAIGKPEGVDINRRGSPSNKSTYHVLKWEVGKDISTDEYQANQDGTGEIYIWFRWLGESWSWKCVSRAEFEQLRSVEG